MNSIADAIAAAKNAAANISTEANGAMQPYAGGGAVGMPAQKAAPLGLDDMLTGALNVVAWLKVTEFGLKVGNDNTLFDEIEVAIPMNEIAYCYSVRYGNPATYEKTYDRVQNARGGSWAEALMRAKKIDPNASEFRSADIPFYLLADLKNKKGEVIVEAGKAVGHSLAVTGWRAFQQFTQKAAAAGIDVRSGIIKLKLGFTEQKNAKGTWGLLDFRAPEEIVAFPWDLN